MMPIKDFIISVYCLVEDQLKEIVKEGHLKRRGSKPKLSDSEVMMVDIVGGLLEGVVKLIRPRGKNIGYE